MTARTLAALGLALALGTAGADAAQPAAQTTATQSAMTAAAPTMPKPAVMKPAVMKPVAMKPVAARPVTSASAKHITAKVGTTKVGGKHSFLVKTKGVHHASWLRSRSAAKLSQLPQRSKLVGVHRTVRSHFAKLAKKGVAKHA